MTTLTKSRIAGMFAAVAAGVGLIAAGTAQEPQPQINKAAPDFTITDVNGKEHTLSSYTEAGKVVVLEWYNPDCPVVKRAHGEGGPLATFGTETDGRDDTVWIAINSGAPGKQGTGKERNAKARCGGMGFSTPFDDSGCSRYTLRSGHWRPRCLPKRGWWAQNQGTSGGSRCGSGPHFLYGGHAPAPEFRHFW